MLRVRVRRFLLRKALARPHHDHPRAACPCFPQRRPASRSHHETDLGSSKPTSQRPAVNDACLFVLTSSLNRPYSTTSLSIDGKHEPVCRTQPQNYQTIGILGAHKILGRPSLIGSFWSRTLQPNTDSQRQSRRPMTSPPLAQRTEWSEANEVQAIITTPESIHDDDRGACCPGMFFLIVLNRPAVRKLLT